MGMNGNGGYWSGFSIGILATLVAIAVLGLAYVSGFGIAWQEASWAVGCERGTVIRQVPAYVTYDGEARQWYCVDRVKP